MKDENCFYCKNVLVPEGAIGSQWITKDETSGNSAHSFCWILHQILVILESQKRIEASLRELERPTYTLETGERHRLSIANE